MATSIVWAAAGAFLGDVFYRFGGNGWPSVVRAAILVAAIGLVAKPVVGPFGLLMRPFADLVERLAPIEGAPTLTLVLGMSILCTAIPMLITRMIVRDMPIRSRP